MARRSSMRSDFVRDAGREPIFSVAISSKRRELPEESPESFGAIDQRAIGLEGLRGNAGHRVDEHVLRPALPLSGSSEASSVAAAMDSRFVAALSRLPYLAAMISPCSVMRMRPCTVPRGCARIASKAGPPPRPTEPPRPWKICIRTPASANTAASARVAWLQAPHGGQVAAILVRIGIADHHFLAAARQRRRTHIGQATAIRA